MASRRIYLIKPCANPACTTRRYFYPHDRRQRFCTPQCRSEYFNDKRSLEEKSLKAHLKKVEEQDKKLHIIYDILERGSKPIELFELEWYTLDFSVAKKEKMLTSTKETLWFNSYGLIKLNRKGTLYQIVCRNYIK